MALKEIRTHEGGGCVLYGDTGRQQMSDEIERLRRGLEVVQSIGCGIPGHAVAIGCDRALAAQAVLGGWEPRLEGYGQVPDEAWSFAEAWVNERNAAAETPEGNE